MPVNPLTEIDQVVANALTQFADLTALVPAGRIQLWDQAGDIRGDLEESADLFERLWVLPIESPLQLYWSSSQHRFERSYEIGFGTGLSLLAPLRDIERQVLRALCRLALLKTAAGAALPVTTLPIEAVTLRGINPQREPPGNSREWRAVCELAVICIAAGSALD